MPKKQYFNQVIFDAQFITLVASYSGANANKIIQFFPRAFETHASPYAGMSGTVFLRRKLA